MNFKDQILSQTLPKHVAIIMDGNGRWAKEKGKFRVFGHKNGVRAVRDTVEGAAEIGLENLSLYAFSTENWNRPKLEVNALMELLVSTINKETATLMENDIRLTAFGDLDSLPSSCRRELYSAIDKTKNNKRMTLNLALSYSSRMEIVNAVKKIALEAKEGKINIEDIDADLFSDKLNSSYLPNPELLIRTSGENRISNFMLWQIAYTELYFTTKLWPDFRREDLFEAILNYQGRERRFGLISEQVS